MLAFAFSSAGALLLGAAASSDLIRLRVEPGDVFHFASRDVVDTQMDPDGKPFKVLFELDRDFHVTIRKVGKGGSVEAELVIDRLAGRIESPLGGSDFASDDGKDEYASMFSDKILQLKMLAGAPLRLAIDSTGRIVDPPGLCGALRGNGSREAARDDGRAVLRRELHERPAVPLCPASRGTRRGGRDLEQLALDRVVRERHRLRCPLHLEGPHGRACALELRDDRGPDRRILPEGEGLGNRGRRRG